MIVKTYINNKEEFINDDWVTRIFNAIKLALTNKVVISILDTDININFNTDYLKFIYKYKITILKNNNVIDTIIKNFDYYELINYLVNYNRHNEHYYFKIENIYGKE